MADREDFTGKEMFLLRKQNYIDQGKPLSKSLRSCWSRQTPYYQELYEESALRANFFHNVQEGLNITEAPKQYDYVKISNLREISRGSQIAWPIEGMASLEAEVKKSGLPFLYHHLLVVEVNSREKTLRVIHFTGATMGTAVVKQETLDVKTKLSSGTIFKIVYNHLRTYPAEIAISRAEERIGDAGIYSNSYKLLSNNCEHMISFFLTGCAVSFQANTCHLPM